MTRETAHIQNRFLNCLRIQVVPGHHEEQRIQNIVEFCKKYAFDNAMLFINAEEYCVGHMTKEEAKPWLETMKRTKEALVKEGITVSLNPWIELGHLDRSRPLKEGQNFTTQVDYEGQKCTMVACPMDENWAAYFLDFYEHIIREIEPEVVWIEDDFRLHNHGTLKYGGCFCEHHMAAFNAELGTNYTRDEFVDRLFRKCPDKKVQKAFLDVNRRCMAELAEKIGTRVKAIGLGTKFGLMCSAHQRHSMEGRDWERLQKGLAQGGPIINRLHLPMYAEGGSMKSYYLKFNELPFVCRGYLPEEVHILPELENACFMTYAKDSETLRFQLESAIPLQVEGMTYDIFDFVGNGTIDAFGYGPAVADITDYLTSVYESGYSYKDLQGITILLDEKNAYHRPIKDSFYDLMPDEFAFPPLLQAHGLSAKCTKKKDLQGEIVVLAAGSVYNFTDEQLEMLFTHNRVILEGKAAELLIDRGMGALIGATGYKKYIADVDAHSYEQVEGARLIYGIPGYRGSAFAQTGDYVAITYSEQPQVESRIFDYNNEEVGYGAVVAKGHLVFPFEITKTRIGMLHPIKAAILFDYVEKCGNILARTDYQNVYAYYSKAEKNVLILVNSTLNNLPVTRFKLIGEAVRKLYEIDRDGVTREKEFTLDEDGFITVNETFAHITTKTFIVE